MEDAPRRRKLTKRKRSNNDEGLSTLSLGPCPEEGYKLAWLVNEGAEFTAGDTLATLVESASVDKGAAAVDKEAAAEPPAPWLVAPQDGTLVARLVAQGAPVPNLAATSVPVASVRLCRHAAVISGMCAVCGRHIALSASSESHLKVALSGCVSDLVVDREEAQATSSKDRLLKAGKLQLILDIDNTLLEATGAAPPPGVPSIRAILLNQGRSLHHIKLRPGLEGFLARASQLFELTLYTHGRREYANQVARAIDPSRAYFGGRLISTPDDVPDLRDQQQKSLARLFPGGTDLCLVLDDREDVWEESDATLSHLLLVRPYKYFNHKQGGALARGSNSNGGDGGVGENGNAGEGGSSTSSTSTSSISSSTSSSRSGSGVEDSCSQLAKCLEVLERVHFAYINQLLPPRGDTRSTLTADGSSASDDRGDGDGDGEKVLGDIATAAQLLHRERGKVLSGCCFVFSGVFPLGTAISETREAAWLRRLGGHVDDDLKPWSTHLVARQPGTEKVRAAIAQGLHVVHLDWLWYTVWHSARACEASLKLHDTPLGHPNPRGRPPRPFPLDDGSARSMVGAATAIGEDGGNGSCQNSEEEDEPLRGGDGDDDDDADDDDDDDLLEELEEAVEFG